MRRPRITVQPDTGRFESLRQAVIDGGGQLVDPDQAEGLIWADPHAVAQFPDVRGRCPELRWVSLPFAGIEPFVPYLVPDLTWTCAKGVYAVPVAEHVLTLALAGMRGLATYARANMWEAPQGRNLVGANVTILGAGGIAEEFIKLLGPFGCQITVVRRQATPMVGVERTLELARMGEGLVDADLVVLALALTDETRGLIGAEEFDAMQNHAWLVNVARGGHINHDDLLKAVREGHIGGAALDVTDPEPLPAGHPLWSEPRIMITPHIANTPEMGIPLLADHVRRNVERFARDEELEGLVSVESGY